VEVVESILAEQPGDLITPTLDDWRDVAPVHAVVLLGVLEDPVFDRRPPWNPERRVRRHDTRLGAHRR
jgi:hypothetical protein